MAYKFRHFGDVEAVEEFPSGASVLIETEGKVRRCPADGLGGSGGLMLNPYTDGRFVPIDDIFDVPEIASLGIETQGTDEGRSLSTYFWVLPDELMEKMDTVAFSSGSVKCLNHMKSVHHIEWVEPDDDELYVYEEQYIIGDVTIGRSNLGSEFWDFLLDKCITIGVPMIDGYHNVMVFVPHDYMWREGVEEKSFEESPEESYEIFVDMIVSESDLQLIIEAFQNAENDHPV